MKLAIFNGSPRGKKSNTKILLDHFIKGFEESGGEIQSTDFLISIKQVEAQVEHFRNADAVLLAFPLYTDSMPGIVKNFIEQIGDFNGSGKKILFFVQSGFPEGIHSSFVKKYLEWLARKWDFEYLGTIIKPGIEGIKMKPDNWNKKIYSAMFEFGKYLAQRGELDQRQIDKFAKPFKLSAIYRGVFLFISLFGITNFYWNHNLKNNNAYQKRFDAPYMQ